MNGWVNGQMDDRMDEWMDDRIDEWMSDISVQMLNSLFYIF